MGPGVGTFAGKTAFASAGASPRYLTTWTVDTGDGDDLVLPAMVATDVGEQERCILYRQGDAAIRIQLGSLLWITLHEGLGWLLASADPADAADFKLGGTPPGRTWQVRSADGWLEVLYAAAPTPILTIHPGSGERDDFAPSVVTPSLEAIVVSGSCRDGDLTSVNLERQDLSGIDLSGASLTSASLDGATFADAILENAVLDRSTIGTARFDGATLDGARFVSANLAGSAWGRPKSARGVVLTGCAGRGAVLGDAALALDCRDAILSSADLRGADLRRLVLTGAAAAGANLSGCRLDDAVLDDARMQSAMLLRASLMRASLRRVRAHGASLAYADLSGADLSQAQLGARSFVLTLPSSYAAQLDEKRYAPTDVISAFLAEGIVISPEDAVEVVAKGARWVLASASGPFDLLLGPNGIDAFLASPDLRPATLRGANCLQTRAPGAQLAGADLRGVRWYAKPATLDHADLEAATLSGSMLANMDFTQAYLSGADLSTCVLVQAQFRGCTIGPGAGRQQFSLEGSLLQGADFSKGSLLSALLIDAAVALTRGVPLFALPAGSGQYLDGAGLASLAPLFADAGHPLGSEPTIAALKGWLIDNAGDPDPSSPRSYRVQPARAAFNVFDAAGGGALFQLPASSGPLLASATASSQLVAAFAQRGYSLAAAAPIVAQEYSQIVVGADAPVVAPIAYPRLRVYPSSSALPVYGSVIVTLRDWSEYPDGLAFAATEGLEAALNATSLGPSGCPRAWFNDGLIDWQTLMTIRAQV